MSLVYIPIALGTLAYLFYFYITRTFNYWKKRRVVGPKPVPFFGNVKQYTLRKKNIGVVVKEIYNAYPNEKIVGFFRTTSPCLLIRDLDIIKHILIKDFDSFEERGIEFSDEGLGTNLFHANGDTWRVLRNRFTPLFTSGKLKKMICLLTERGDYFMKYVDSITASQSEHDVYLLVQKYTLATISECAFGIDIDTHNNQHTTDMFQNLGKALLTPSLANLFDIMYPGILKTFNKTIYPKFVVDFFHDLINNIAQERHGVPSDRKDLMDILLELREKTEIHATKKSENDNQLTLEPTDHLLAAQASFFFGAGFEASATAIMYVLYKLAHNPEIQEKLHADIDTVVKKHDGKLTYETLQDMTYLEKIFDEALRMHPIGDPMLRRAKVDYKIPGTNVTIAAGTSVMVSVTGIHKDAKYYPNPEIFDPERHTLQKSKERHTCAYLPFGVGPRHCIGMRFAKVQSWVCLVKLLSKFRMEVSENTPKEEKLMFPSRIILGPRSGVYLNMIRRCP